MSNSYLVELELSAMSGNPHIYICFRQWTEVCVHVEGRGKRTNWFLLTSMLQQQTLEIFLIPGEKLLTKWTIIQHCIQIIKWWNFSFEKFESVYVRSWQSVTCTPNLDHSYIIHSFTFLSVAALVFEWQRWVGGTETTWPINHKRVTIWPFTIKKVHQPLL